MPIAALSEKAARAICSTLVLNDAISVIKELIDNALDANASNIIIELSANTLDTIQVKDNGTGIGVEDRQLLCKTGFTSKIRTFDDLTQLGGTFLGFRGEALSSVAGLSESVTFTTRIDGETVGTLLKFDSNGKLSSSSSAAHGTGTTVRVSEFLKSIPVRRQTALKQATKTLNNVKRLLFDYAFARPTVRFQFKVLKSGGDLKANWSFVPCKDASNLNVLASKIVGKDVAAQCEQTTITSDDGDHKIDALLFARDADISKCGSSDRFVSIDGRPLTVDRGLMKDLNKIYKSHISGVVPDGVVVPNKVFLLLRLDFPQGSYDVNVEPAKNEVMFEDSGFVLSLFESLCKLTYGEKTVQSTTKKTTPKDRIDATADFGVLLAKKAPLVGLTSESREVTNLLTIPQVQELQEQRVTDNESDIPKMTKVFRNMYGVDEHGLLAPQIEDDNVSEGDIPLEVEDIMSPQVTNPFTLAKVNTLLKPRNVSDMKSITTQGGSESVDDQSTRFANLLPSPSPSPDKNMIYQNPGPPNRPWKTRQIQNENAASDLPSPVSMQPISESGKPTLLDSWARLINSSSPQRASPDSIEVRRSEPINILTRVAPKSTSNSIQSQTPSKRPAGLSSTHQSGFRTPFRRTSNVEISSPNSGGQSVGSSNTKLATQQTESSSPLELSNPKFAGLERPRVLPDTELDEIMDFEHRKRSTILEHRERTRQPRSDKGLNRGEQRHEGQAFSIPARPEKEGLSPTNQDTNYGSKFGQGDDDINIPAQPNSASYTQNPHLSRYKKALRDLDDRTEKQATAEAGSRITERREIVEDEFVSKPHQKGQAEQRIKLSPTDPRAYLIRLTDEKGAQDLDNTTRPKKSTIAKLPFETVDPVAATYTYVGITDPGVTDDTRQLSIRTNMLDKIDPYVRNGKIPSEISPGNVTENVVRQWEGTIQSLLGGVDTIESGVSQEDGEFVPN